MLLHLIVVSLVQGITEFIPVSSSAHLALIPLLTKWPDQGLIVDVAAHMGTLGAVVIYFREDVASLWREALQVLMRRRSPHFLGHIVIATVPAVIAGFFLKNWIEGATRTLLFLGCTSLVFGGLLWLSDKMGSLQRRVSDMSFSHAFIIGCAQAFSILPGASRSGTTITMARALGYARGDTFRFSFLLSIPVILGAGILTGYDAYKSGISLVSTPLLLTFVLSFLSGYATIALMVKLLERMTFTPFAVYRIVFGLILIFLGAR